MKQSTRLRYFAFSFILLFALHSTVHAACTAITASQNRTITAAGNYCLTGNLTVTTASNVNVGAITINPGVNNVTIDLAGYEIKNNNVGYGAGVYGAGINKNITIKNGSINGFWNGIYIGGNGASAVNSIIDGIRFLNYSNDAIKLDEGFGNVIRNCVAYGDNLYDQYGIHLHGSSYCSVVNNEVINAAYQGIDIGECFNCVAQGNRVSGSTTRPDSIGIRAIRSDALIENNLITNYSTCIDMTESTTTKYRNNLTIGCPDATKYVGGINAGNNN